MHFQQLLRWCHVAYEESLERFGVASDTIFPAPGRIPAVALPIVHISADYLRPLACGDPLAIELRPRQRDDGSFEVRYRFLHEGREAANALTRHVAIDATSRRRTPLPGPIRRWLEASTSFSAGAAWPTGARPAEGAATPPSGPADGGPHGGRPPGKRS
jgi:1,4-dihydroxy-2-naphthoyl-CoA hydrolase